MKVCPSCKARYSDEDQFCSRCGSNLVQKPLEEQEPFRQGKRVNLFLIYVLPTILLVSIVAGIFFYLNYGPSKTLPVHQPEKSEEAIVPRQNPRLSQK